MRRSRRSLAVLLALAVVAPVGGAAALTPTVGVGDHSPVVCRPRAEPVPRGEATLVSSRPSPGAEDRITEYTLHSPALGRTTRVNVLFPADYDAGQRYPVLYLLHGAAGSHRDWQTIGAVRRVVDETRAAHGLPPFLVVMPDAGAFGFYSDWYGVEIDGHNGDGPPPAWTTYHLDELLPWVEATLPVVAERRGRAVAGLSMGGFGTMSYATRFPDRFVAAGSFSGALHPSWNFPTGNVFVTGASGFFTGGRGLDQCIWGEFATQQVRWLAADPVHLAANLRGAGLELYVASGGGDLDRPGGLVTDPVEQTCYFMSRAFTDALARHGVPVDEDFYAEGGHDWAYWQRGLGRFLPIMARAFADPPAEPAHFDHDSAATRFRVWDWQFEARREVTEFLSLRDVGPSGLLAVGSGQVDVVTAARFQPGARYRVARVATNGTSGAVEVLADAAGRLRFDIDLGPSHRSQQVRFDEAATADWVRAAVTIARAA